MSYYLFIDESGDHNLKSSTKGSPLFLLCGCSFLFNEVDNLTKKIDTLKLKHFGTTNIILHYREIRKREGCFVVLMDKTKNDEFINDLKTLLNEIDFKIIVSMIDKKTHIECYGKVADDPYELSLNFIIERFIFSKNNSIRGAKIVAEKRGDREDKKLLESWVKIFQRGTYFINSQELQLKIGEFKMEKKSENICGLQIADIAASSILRKFIRPNEDEEIFEIIKEKIIFYGKGCIGKGVKIFPEDSSYKKTISPLI